MQAYAERSFAARSAEPLDASLAQDDSALLTSDLCLLTSLFRSPLAPRAHGSGVGRGAGGEGRCLAFGYGLNERFAGFGRWDLVLDRSGWLG